VHAPEPKAARVELPSLLREMAIPESIPAPPASFNGVSRVCVSCHAPRSQHGPPEASTAAMLAGRGGVDPMTGAALSASTAPHASDARGCLSCHDSGPLELRHGRGHAFEVTPAGCARCHERERERDPKLRERAFELLKALGAPAPSAGDPPHAARQSGAPGDDPRARALRNVLLVLEDRAADVHHPTYARELLDATEHLIRGANR
jgi:hypothetical protein